tara:strand:- start:127 stop:486 length:360 start_codon:yes stop_codon:yes gene_type:complete
VAAMTEEQKKRFAEALDRVSGDCELLAAMATMVTEDAPDVLAGLREQVAQDDMLAAAATAHKLKGMLSTFDTGGPVPELEQLISAARKGHSDEVVSTLSSCVPEVENLLKEIVSLEQVA